MQTIYLVVQHVSVPGHGESYDYTALCRTGQWDEHYAPAYTSRAEAEKQREILGRGKVIELSLLDVAAP